MRSTGARLHHSALNPVPPALLARRQVMHQLGVFVSSGLASSVLSDRLDSKVAKRQRIRSLLKVCPGLCGCWCVHDRTVTMWQQTSTRTVNH